MNGASRTDWGVSTCIVQTRGRSSPGTRMLALPRTTGSRRRELTMDHGGTITTDWGQNRGGESSDVSWSTICTNIVLVGSELTAFGGDTLQVLLSRGIGITDLQKKAFLANRLAVELLDDLFADIAALKAVRKVSIIRECRETKQLTVQNRHLGSCEYEGHGGFCWS